MSSGKLPAVDQAGASPTPSNTLPDTFLGLALYLGSDRLYHLVKDIPDVMGLRALRPSAAIVKVMSVPDNRCVRVVTPDDHVNIGFHEVLIHDLEEEELPFVALSELGCLRLDWPKTLFTFMSRCARTAGSVLVPHSRGLVRLVVNIYSRIWANILPCITWSSRSCGDARSRGVRFGRAQLRIVSII